jgi:hypothetical protein
MLTRGSRGAEECSDAHTSERAAPAFRNAFELRSESRFPKHCGDKTPANVRVHRESSPLLRERRANILNDADSTRAYGFGAELTAYTSKISTLLLGMMIRVPVASVRAVYW